MNCIDEFIAIELLVKRKLAYWNQLENMMISLISDEESEVSESCRDWAYESDRQSIAV